MRLFGEDNSTVQPDEFFGTFDTFLVAFQEARHDNGNLKRKRDEEEKRAKQDAEVRTKSTAVLCSNKYIKKYNVIFLLIKLRVMFPLFS